MDLICGKRSIELPSALGKSGPPEKHGHGCVGRTDELPIRQSTSGLHALDSHSLKLPGISFPLHRRSLFPDTVPNPVRPFKVHIPF
jgi:hypothetical protein